MNVAMLSPMLPAARMSQSRMTGELVSLIILDRIC